MGGEAGLAAGERDCRVREVGGWTITALTDGDFRLDGGAMWGVVPANLWRRLTPPAEDNTIAMSLRPFLAQRGDETVLIEGGAGYRWSDKLRRIYHLEGCGRLEGSLRSAGVDPAAITHVVMSHCHWDHIGSLVGGTDAAPEPLCPNARHFAPAIEVERCLNPDHVRRGSYRPEDLAPLVDAGLVETFEGRAEPIPGLVLHELGGHSDGVSVVTVGAPGAVADGDGNPGEGSAGDGAGDDGDVAIFWSDVVPTTHHVQPPYIMAYDIDVERSFNQRGAWLERAARAGWLGLFYHDLEQPFARLEHDGRRFGAVSA